MRLEAYEKERIGGVGGVTSFREHRYGISVTSSISCEKDQPAMFAKIRESGTVLHLLVGWNRGNAITPDLP